MATAAWPHPGVQSASEDVHAQSGLVRLGAGTYRWLGLKIYDAQLWTAGGPPNFARPFALELRYARSLKGAEIAQRSIEAITDLGLGSPEKRRDWARTLARLFPDVVEGDTLSGCHLPGRGARFYRDNRPLGEIGDPEFSHAFFSIWLDPRTSAPGLRAEILGARRP